MKTLIFHYLGGQGKNHSCQLDFLTSTLLVPNILKEADINYFFKVLVKIGDYKHNIHIKIITFGKNIPKVSEQHWTHFMYVQLSQILDHTYLLIWLISNLKSQWPNYLISIKNNELFLPKYISIFED